MRACQSQIDIMRACQRQIDIKDRQWQTELDRYLGQIELADVDRYLGQIEIADVDRQSQQMNELDKCVPKILQIVVARVRLMYVK